MIGIDLDNTIVCYDGVFYRAALARGLIPSETPDTKESVKTCILEKENEKTWTELQGLVYGPLMEKARPFPGVMDFIASARRNGTPVKIISHRTKYPYEGERYDLHQAAMTWLDGRGVFSPRAGCLTPEDIFFEESFEAKIIRIKSTGCTHFIDDLPELLLNGSFPETCARLLFDPGENSHRVEKSGPLHVFRSWEQAGRYFNV